MGLLPDTQSCGLRMRRECRERFPRFTHVPWCMTRSLTIGFLWSRWRGKCSRHSRCMRNLQFCVSGKRPIRHVARRPLGWLLSWYTVMPMEFMWRSDTCRFHPWVPAYSNETFSGSISWHSCSSAPFCIVNVISEKSDCLIAMVLSPKSIQNRFSVILIYLLNMLYAKVFILGVYTASIKIMKCTAICYQIFWRAAWEITILHIITLLSLRSLLSLRYCRIAGIMATPNLLKYELNLIIPNSNFSGYLHLL